MAARFFSAVCSMAARLLGGLQSSKINLRTSCSEHAADAACSLQIASGPTPIRAGRNAHTRLPVISDPIPCVVYRSDRDTQCTLRLSADSTFNVVSLRLARSFGCRIRWRVAGSCPEIDDNVAGWCRLNIILDTGRRWCQETIDVRVLRSETDGIVLADRYAPLLDIFLSDVSLDHFQCMSPLLSETQAELSDRLLSVLPEITRMSQPVWYLSLIHI